MQGRLSPPIGGRIQSFPADHWRDEFPRAHDAGLSSIEWIYETSGRDGNPLCTDEGVRELRSLAARHEVAVRSVCADYFMEYPLVRVGGADLVARVEHLRWLIARCRVAGIERIVLPFVDASEVQTAEEEAALVEILVEAHGHVAAAGLELHLEMSFAPGRFAAFLARLPDAVRVNYDSGNSASFGYHPDEELAAYGDRIGSVHIKDRILGGGTVPLGDGNADLPAFFAGLNRIDYRGDMILQVARGDTGREVEWARHNRELVEAAFA